MKPKKVKEDTKHTSSSNDFVLVKQSLRYLYSKNLFFDIKCQPPPLGSTREEGKIKRLLLRVNAVDTT